MMNATLTALFMAATTTYHLPPGLLRALCFVESKGIPSAVHHDDGSQDSLGVCQVQHRTAKFMGFEGTEADLMLPAINIDYSARYLRYQLVRYHGDVLKAVSAYNVGSYRAGEDGLPVNRGYVAKVLLARQEGR